MWRWELKLTGTNPWQPRRWRQEAVRERRQEGSHQVPSECWRHTPLCVTCCCFSPNTLNSAPGLSRMEPQDGQAQDPDFASPESNADWFRGNLESFPKMIKHLSQKAGKLSIMLTTILKKGWAAPETTFNFTHTDKVTRIQLLSHKQNLPGPIGGRSETIRKSFQTVKLTKRWCRLVTLTKLVSNCFLHD